MGLQQSSSEGVGEQPRRAYTRHANQFIFVAGPTTRTHGPHDVAMRIFDQNSARLWQKFALSRRRQRHKEIGVVFGSLRQNSARGAHADGPPRFTARDVKAKHAGAIFSRKSDQLARIIQDHDTHRFVVGQAGGFARFLKNMIRLIQ